MTTSSQVIAARLVEAGVLHAFGIPGGEVLALMDALRENGIAITLARHENCAGFMGEGVWHATGAPAVLFATIGPGIANAVNTIANAWQDRVPMIVLTGCVPAVDVLSYTHQVFDHSALLAPITKGVFRVEKGTAALTIDKALMLATTGRPGPVALDVPIDVQRMQEVSWARSAHRAQSPMAPSGEDLNTARGWLKDARRPLVLAGLDVLVQDASDAVAAFCHETGAALVTTYKAKGVVPEDDPLALGGAGLSPKCDEILLPVVQASDCVILAGYDPIEMRTGWRDPFGADQRVVDIAAEPNSHYMHQGILNFTGDIRAALTALSAPKTGTWPGGEPSEARTALIGVTRRTETWGPAAVVDEARKASPRDTVATVDSGAHRIVLSQIWECYEPRGLLQSTALCTMGCAVPLAIGRKLAEPERPVIAFVGDGGMEMFLGELATARDLGLSLPIVVFVDEQLALIELKQRGQQMPNVGVEFGRTDFVAVAEALGGTGVSVETREDLNKAVTQAFTRDGVTVIEAVIGRNAYDDRI